MLTNLTAMLAGSVWAMTPDALRTLTQVLDARVLGAGAADVRAALEAAESRAAKAGTPSSPQQALNAAEAGVVVPEGTALVGIGGPILNRAGALATMCGAVSPQQVAAQVLAAADDKAVKRLVLDINSPGGTMAGTPELADAVAYAASKKPVVSVISGFGASAAYHVASQGTEVVGAPASNIGSIGVVYSHLDNSALYEKVGQRWTFITSGEMKTWGTDTAPLGDAVRARIQSQVTATAQQFYEAVARGRKMTTADVVARYGDAAIFTETEALQNGLIDRIGTLRAVLAEASGGPPSVRRTAPAVKPAVLPSVRPS